MILTIKVLMVIMKILYFINLMLAFIVNSVIVFSSSGSVLTKGLTIIYLLLSIGSFALIFDKKRDLKTIPDILKIGLFTSLSALISCAIADLVINAPLIVQVVCSMSLIIVGGCVAIFKLVRQK